MTEHDKLDLRIMQDLKNLQKSKDTLHFISTVLLHDTRSDQTLIKGAIDLLKNTVVTLPAEYHGQFDTIIGFLTRANDHTIGVTQDIADSVKYLGFDNVQQIDLEQMVHDIKNQTTHRNEQGLGIDVKTTPDSKTIYGAIGPIKRIIENYVINAYKFAERSPIVIDISKQQGDCIIDVCDYQTPITDEKRAVFWDWERKLILKPEGEKRRIAWHGLGIIKVGADCFGYEVGEKIWTKKTGEPAGEIFYLKIPKAYEKPTGLSSNHYVI